MYQLFKRALRAMELHDVLFGQALLLKLLLGLFSFNTPGAILIRQLIGRHQFHLRPDAQLDELFFLPFLNVVTDIKNFAA